MDAFISTFNTIRTQNQMTVLLIGSFNMTVWCDIAEALPAFTQNTQLLFWTVLTLTALPRSQILSPYPATKVSPPLTFHPPPPPRLSPCPPHGTRRQRSAKTSFNSSCQKRLLKWVSCVGRFLDRSWLQFYRLWQDGWEPVWARLSWLKRKCCFGALNSKYFMHGCFRPKSTLTWRFLPLSWQGLLVFNHANTSHANAVCQTPFEITWYTHLPFKALQNSVRRSRIRSCWFSSSRGRRQAVYSQCDLCYPFSHLARNLFGIKTFFTLGCHKAHLSQSRSQFQSMRIHH